MTGYLGRSRARCECGKIGALLTERLDPRNLRPERKLLCGTCARRDGYTAVNWTRTETANRVIA